MAHRCNLQVINAYPIDFNEGWVANGLLKPASLPLPPHVSPPMSLRTNSHISGNHKIRMSINHIFLSNQITAVAFSPIPLLFDTRHHMSHTFGLTLI